MEVAPGIYRLGTYWINWYIVVESDRLTIVDTAVSGYWPQLIDWLTVHNRHLRDVAAVVLTHAHPDHLGLAERLRTECNATVYIHPEDGAVATGEARGKPPPGILANIWRPHLLRYGGHCMRNGMMRTAPIAEVQTFSEGDVLDVPGNPRVVYTPGHSPGHCSFLFEDRDALLAGDAIATMNLMDGSRGPILMPVNEDAQRARASLDALDGVEAGIVAPGHGEPWADGMAAAMKHVRARLGD